MSTEDKFSPKSTNPKDRIGVTKPPLELLPAAFEILVSLALKNGAIKYGRFNWRDEKVSASIYIGAAKRHLAAWFDGEELAQDSGVHHIAHAAACMAIILDAQATNNLVDDRPKKGAAAALLKTFTEPKSAPVEVDYETVAEAIRKAKETPPVFCNECGNTIPQCSCSPHF